MKRMAAVIAAFVLLTAISALAIHKLGDRELFVSPPDAIAEGFFRAVITKRPAQARPYLLNPVSLESIVQLERTIKARLGHVDDVKTEIISRTNQEALVSVRLRSPQTTGQIAVSLAWNGEEWKVVQSAFQ